MIAQFPTWVRLPVLTHIQIDGSPQDHDCAAAFMSGDRLLALASMGRDQESLQAERRLER